MAIILPELILLDGIKKLLTLIRTDYQNNIADTTQSLLYRILNGNNLQRYKMFDQAVSVFITKPDDPRNLDVNLFFNAKRASIPTLHITLPSESEKNNVMAAGEGYRDPIFDENIGEYKKVFNRRFNAGYNMIITSDNTNEVVLIYHFMRSALISLSPHLTLAGLQNIKLSGGDLQLNSDIVPSNIFIRSTNINFEYDVEAIELSSSQLGGSNISINSIPLKIE